jgi:hypothetical protein
MLIDRHLSLCIVRTGVNVDRWTPCHIYTRTYDAQTCICHTFRGQGLGFRRQMLTYTHVGAEAEGLDAASGRETGKSLPHRQQLNVNIPEASDPADPDTPRGTGIRE